VEIIMTSINVNSNNNSLVNEPNKNIVQIHQRIKVNVTRRGSTSKPLSFDLDPKNEVDLISQSPYEELMEESSKAGLPFLLFELRDTEGKTDRYGPSIKRWLDKNNVDPTSRKKVKTIKIFQYDPKKNEFDFVGKIREIFSAKNQEDVTKVGKESILMELLIKACDIEKAQSPDQSLRMQSIVAAHNYAESVLELGHVDEAFAWYERALNATAFITENPLILFKKKLTNGLRRVAQAYLKNGLEGYKKAIEVAKKIGDESFILETIKAVPDVAKNLLRKDEIKKTIDLMDQFPVGPLKNDVIYALLNYFFSKKKPDATVPYLNFLSKEAENKNDILELASILKYKIHYFISQDRGDEAKNYLIYVFKKAINEPKEDFKIVALLKISEIWQHYIKVFQKYDDFDFCDQLINSIDPIQISIYVDILLLISNTFCSQLQYKRARAVIELIFVHLELQGKEQSLRIMHKISPHLNPFLLKLAENGELETAIDLAAKIPILSQKLISYCEIASNLVREAEPQQPHLDRALELIEIAIKLVDSMPNENDQQSVCESISDSQKRISLAFARRGDFGKSLDFAQKIANTDFKDERLLEIINVLFEWIKSSSRDEFFILIEIALYAAKKLSTGFKGQELSRIARELILKDCITLGMETANDAAKDIETLISETNDIEYINEIVAQVKENLVDISEVLTEKDIINEALNAALMIPCPFTRTEALLKISKKLWDLNQDWKSVAKMSIEAAKSIKNEEELSYALSDIVDYLCDLSVEELWVSESSQESLEILEEARILASLIPDNMLQSDAFYDITEIFIEAGEIEKATISIKQAINADKMITNGDNSNVADIDFSLSSDLEDVEKLLALHRTTYNNDSKAKSLQKLSKILFSKGQFDEALEIVEEVFDVLLKRAKDPEKVDKNKTFKNVLNQFLKIAKDLVLGNFATLSSNNTAMLLIEMSLRKSKMLDDKEDIGEASIKITVVVEEIIQDWLSSKNYNKAYEMTRLIPLDLSRSRVLLNLSKTLFSIDYNLFYKTVKAAMKSTVNIPDEDKTELLADITQHLKETALKTLKIDPKKGIKLLKKSIFAASCIPNPKPKAEKLSDLAAILFTNNEFDQGIEVTKQALDAFYKLKDEDKGLPFLAISENLSSSAKEMVAKGLYKKSMAVVQWIPDELKKSYFFYDIAEISMKKGLLDIPLIAIRSAISSAQAINVELLKDKFLAEITSWLIQKAKTLALQNDEKALKFAQLIPDTEKKLEVIAELKKKPEISANKMEIC
jgi:hypothetical protein